MANGEFSGVLNRATLGNSALDPGKRIEDEVKREQETLVQRAKDANEAFQETVFAADSQLRQGGIGGGKQAVLFEQQIMQGGELAIETALAAGRPTAVLRRTLAGALERLPKVPSTQFTLGADESRFTEQGDEATRIASQGKSFAPTVVGPGQQAVTTQGPIAGSAVPAETVDIQEPLTGAANLSLKMLEEGTDPSQIAAILEVMATGSGNERLTAGLDAIIQSLPESQEAFQVERSQQEVEASQPKINELVSAGLSRDVATALVIGGRGATVNLQASPTAFGEGELAKIRGDIRTSRSVGRAIESVIPLINEGTIGLFPAFSETVGGVAQNLPVIRDILNAIGKPLGLDIKSVKTAQEGRAAFRQVIGVFSRFISQKGGRLSNEDRQFAREAVRLLETSSLPETVIGALQTLARLAQKIESAAQGELQTGGVAPQRGQPRANITVRPKDGGGFEVIDEQGNTQTLTVQ